MIIDIKAHFYSEWFNKYEILFFMIVNGGRLFHFAPIRIAQIPLLPIVGFDISNNYKDWFNRLINPLQLFTMLS